jgi:hypothetical protein|tara:strand:- start:112 stop:447 length:336 start_codon:yes stop_codon:yes gene_type:complete
MKKLFFKFLFFVIDCWRVVMDNRYNPLKYIADPSMQGYFTMVLFTMWSVYFGLLATTYIGWFNYDIVTSIFVHFAVIFPIMITNLTFKEAEQNGSKWYKEYKPTKSISGKL